MYFTHLERRADDDQNNNCTSKRVLYINMRKLVDAYDVFR